MSCFTGRISAGISDHSTVAFEVAHVAPIRLKFGVEDVDSSAPNFIPPGAEVESGTQKHCTLNEIWKYNQSTAAYTLRDSYVIFGVCGQFHRAIRPFFKFGQIRSSGSKLGELNRPHFTALYR